MATLLISAGQSLNSAESVTQVGSNDLPPRCSRDDRSLLCEHCVMISQLVVTHTFYHQPAFHQAEACRQIETI